MSTLKDRLLKLGNAHPNIRPHIAKVLDTIKIKVSSINISPEMSAGGVITSMLETIYFKLEEYLIDFTHHSRRQTLQMFNMKHAHTQGYHAVSFEIRPDYIDQDSGDYLGEYGETIFKGLIVYTGKSFVLSNQSGSPIEEIPDSLNLDQISMKFNETLLNLLPH